jgi:hypothetical protein
MLDAGGKWNATAAIETVKHGLLILRYAQDDRVGLGPYVQ